MDLAKFDDIAGWVFLWWQIPLYWLKESLPFRYRGWWSSFRIWFTTWHRSHGLSKRQVKDMLRDEIYKFEQSMKG